MGKNSSMKVIAGPEDPSSRATVFAEEVKQRADAF